MIKTEFMSLYEDLSVLNESAAEDFTRVLEKKFDKMLPQLNDIINELYLGNKSGALRRLIGSLRTGFQICKHVHEQLININKANDPVINLPYDEALGILNRLDEIIFIYKQGDSAINKYIKKLPDLWTEHDLKADLQKQGIDTKSIQFATENGLTMSTFLSRTASFEKNTSQTHPDSAEKDSKSTDEAAAISETKNAKLNRSRQNNSKIMKAFKEVGLPTDDLVDVAKNKNGRDYKKASQKLNKLRKTLFGEAFEEESDNPFDQEF